MNSKIIRLAGATRLPKNPRNERSTTVPLAASCKLDCIRAIFGRRSFDHYRSDTPMQSRSVITKVNLAVSLFAYLLDLPAWKSTISSALNAAFRHAAERRPLAIRRALFKVDDSPRNTRERSSSCPPRYPRAGRRAGMERKRKKEKS